MRERTNYNVCRFPLVFLLSLAVATGAGQQVQVEGKAKFIRNGQGTKPFDVTRHLIPLRQIHGGGPPRDAIPALNDPPNMSAEQAERLLNASDRVLGVVFGGQAKAYPVRILNWHELVNDTVGGRRILVSW